MAEPREMDSLLQGNIEQERVEEACVSSRMSDELRKLLDEYLATEPVDGDESSCDDAWARRSTMAVDRLVELRQRVASYSRSVAEEDEAKHAISESDESTNRCYPPPLPE